MDYVAGFFSILLMALFGFGGALVGSTFMKNQVRECYVLTQDAQKCYDAYIKEKQPMWLKIRYRNSTYDIRDRYASYMNIPEYFDYVGWPIPNPKWVGPDCFCLKYAEHPLAFRILKRDNIICGWKYE